MSAPYIRFRGQKFKLVRPYQLAYGEKSFPPIIPEKSSVVYEIELKAQNQNEEIYIYATECLSYENTWGIRC